MEYTKRAVAIGQDQVVTITADDVTVTDFFGAPVHTEPFEIAWDASAAEKGGWSSFMAKEISEGPEAIAKTLLGRIVDGAVKLDEVAALPLTEVDRIVILGCGTAAYSGMLAKYAIEKWARIPVEVELSHEFRYRDPVIDSRTLVISVSQSGETMDTLMAVKYAIDAGARTLSICNTQGATIPAGVGCRDLHARGPRGRRRIDQGVRGPGRRVLPLRPAPRRRARGAPDREVSRTSRGAAAASRSSSRRCSARPSRSASSPAG